jgi:hypothetical protein
LAGDVTSSHLVSDLSSTSPRSMNSLNLMKPMRVTRLPSRGPPLSLPSPFRDLHSPAALSCSLSTGFVGDFSPSVAGAPSGSLSQISEEISKNKPHGDGAPPSSATPSVNSSGTNDLETPSPAIADSKKSKGIADLVNAKKIGHKWIESMGFHTATEAPQTSSDVTPNAPAPVVDELEREREEMRNCQLTVTVTRGELVHSHPTYEVPPLHVLCLCDPPSSFSPSLGG